MKSALHISLSTKSKDAVDITALPESSFLVSESDDRGDWLFPVKESKSKVNKFLLVEALDVLSVGTRPHNVSRESLSKAWKRAVKLAEAVKLEHDLPSKDPYTLQLGVDEIPVGESVEMRITEDLLFSTISESCAREAQFQDSEDDAESVSEAKKSPGTVTYDAIVEGRSLNGGYYLPEAIEDFSRLVVQPGSKKMYDGHLEGKKWRPRRNDEWAAVVVKSSVRKGDNGKGLKQATISVVEARFTGNPKTLWLYGEAKKNPEEVGVSISAMALVSNGVGPDGVEGPIIERITFAESLDMVPMPAAGGKATGVNESVNRQDNPDMKKDVEAQLKEIHETIQSLSEDVEFKGTLSKSMSLLDAMFTALWGTLRDVSLSNELDEDARPDAVKKALADFRKEVLKLDVVGIFQSFWGVVEEETPASEALDTLIEHSKRRSTMDLKDAKLSDVQEQRPDLVDSFKENFAKESQGEELQKDNEKLNKELSKEAEAHKATKSKLDDYEAAEAERTRCKDQTAVIDKIFEEEGLDKEFASELFMEDLLSYRDTDSSKAEDQIRSRVKDRVVLIEGQKPSGDVNGMGNKDHPKKPSKNGKQKPTRTLDEALAQMQG
tara:strand:- start:1633 stop:3453 length:1821 start_codon:yes stop_codon:yes gene_type:complete